MSDFLTTCAGDHTNEKLARAAAAHLLDAQTATHVAELFKAFADPTRVRIIGLLAHVELCVGDLCLALDMSQPAISHQLRVLRNLRIVTARKEGKHVFYKLDDEHVHALFHQGLVHIQHE